jgi:hypothetical protein
LNGQHDTAVTVNYVGTRHAAQKRFVLKVTFKFLTIVTLNHSVGGSSSRMHAVTFKLAGDTVAPDLCKVNGLKFSRWLVYKPQDVKVRNAKEQQCCACKFCWGNLLLY